jgi:hypothetical protein
LKNPQVGQLGQLCQVGSAVFLPSSRKTYPATIALGVSLQKISYQTARIALHDAGTHYRRKRIISNYQGLAATNIGHTRFTRAWITTRPCRGFSLDYNWWLSMGRLKLLQRKLAGIADKPWTILEMLVAIRQLTYSSFCNQ